MKKFRVKYSFTTPDQIKESSGVKDFEAGSPIAALNEFHRFMQLSSDLDSHRVIVRPRLKPPEYKITGFYHVYHNAALHKDPFMQPLVESPFDLPKSENPDLNPDNQKEIIESQKEWDFAV